MTELVLMETRGAVALLTLNRPGKLNALNYAMIDRLQARLAAIEADAALRLVILTGAGERAFSAGGDIAEFSRSVAAGPEAALRDFVDRGQGLTARLEAFPKPVIVAVNGLAFGGGCEVTEAAHLAVASDRAEFSKPEIALGMPPTFGGTQRLARLAGRKRALEHLLTGDRFGPERALAIGLVNHIAPHDRLLEACFDLAERILAHQSAAASAILRAATRGLNMSIGEGLKVEADQFARLVGTPGLDAALDAWLNRREPAARS